jgi:hypothetical protein
METLEDVVNSLIFPYLGSQVVSTLTISLIMYVGGAKIFDTTINYYQ